MIKISESRVALNGTVKFIVALNKKPSEETVYK